MNARTLIAWLLATACRSQPPAPVSEKPERFSKLIKAQTPASRRMRHRARDPIPV